MLSREEVAARIMAMPVEYQEAAARAALELYGPAPETFRAYVDRVRPGYQWYRHAEVLGDVLQRVADGEIKRLMIFEPVRHGKTEQAAKLFSSYMVKQRPERFVGVASYGDELAHGISRASRRFTVAAGVEIAPDSRAVGHWETAEGGGLWATGVGGSATGKGGHLLILDDPIKGADKAQSETVRNSTWDWWESVFSTRLEPGGAVILIMTRWNEDDVAGRLLKMEHQEELAEGWHIVNLPAIREPLEEEQAWPASCTVEPDWREPGEPLCPERYPIDVLERIRARNPYWFSALFQQRPQARGSTMFPRAAWRIVDAAPAGLSLCRFWDKASADAGKGDYTAGVLMGEIDGRYYVLDVVHGQWPAHERNDVMRSTAVHDRARYGAVRIRIEQPPGFGVEATKGAIKALAGFPVKGVPVRGDKTERAEPWSAQVCAGNVHLVAGDWNQGFIDEHGAFPRGKHDDRVDAGAGAFSELANAGSGAHRLIGIENALRRRLN